MKKNDERYERVIDLYLEGMTIVDISKITGVSRPTIYKLLEDEEYKSVINKRLQDLRNAGQNRLQNKLITYVGELEKLAMTTDNENTKKDCLFYLINRILGTPTSKIEQTVEEKTQNNTEDIETLLKVVDDDYIQSLNDASNM